MLKEVRLLLADRMCMQTDSATSDIYQHLVTQISTFISLARCTVPMIVIKTTQKIFIATLKFIDIQCTVIEEQKPKRYSNQLI